MTKKRDLPPGVVSSVDDLASALGYNRRTVMEWKSQEGFPIRRDGNYEILRVHEWRERRWFSEKLTQDDYWDISNRSHELIDMLFDMQSELVGSLPENVQESFAVLLRDAIGQAIKKAFDGDYDASFYAESYVAKYDEDEACRILNHRD